jgi:hypothetical protein
MKIFILLILVSCGKPDTKGQRCRSAEEAQMKCQIDYAEAYSAFNIPDYIKRQCESLYSSPGCYFDSSKRHYW